MKTKSKAKLFKCDSKNGHMGSFKHTCLRVIHKSAADYIICCHCSMETLFSLNLLEDLR